MLTNPKHEAFALAVAEGLSATQAYRHHVGRCTTKSAMEAGSRLLADVKVASRVAELRIGFRKLLEDRLGVSRETIARYFVSILETPVGEVDENSSLCQEYRRTRRIRSQGNGTEEWETEQIKMLSKMDAAKQLAQLCGWNEPEQSDGKIEVILRNFPAKAETALDSVLLE